MSEGPIQDKALKLVICELRTIACNIPILIVSPIMGRFSGCRRIEQRCTKGGLIGNIC